LANNNERETLVAVRNAEGEEIYRFLEWGEYEVKLVNVRKPRQFVVMSWWDVTKFAAAIDELEKLNKY
jgi:hypothetical protein